MIPGVRRLLRDAGLRGSTGELQVEYRSVVSLSAVPAGYAGSSQTSCRLHLLFGYHLLFTVLVKREGC